MIEPRPFGCFAIFFGVLAVAAIVAILRSDAAIEATMRWPAAEGVVTHVRTHQGRRSTRTYVDVDYAVAGQSHTATLEVGSAYLQKGDKVTVRYSPQSPGEAVINEVTSINRDMYIIEAFGTGFLAIALTVIWVVIRERNRRQRARG
jgi:hypothetical protein